MSVSALRLLTGLERPTPDGENRPSVTYTPAQTVLVLTAGLAFVGGLIHVGAAVDHYEEFPLYTLAFSVIALLQVSWAWLLVRGPSRAILLAGALMQLGIVALWVVSRTAGVPIAPKAWTPEEVGIADLVATLGELVTVIAAFAVLAASTQAWAQRMLPRLAPIVLAAVLMSALFGTGAHAG